VEFARGELTRLERTKLDGMTMGCVGVFDVRSKFEDVFGDGRRTMRVLEGRVDIGTRKGSESGYKRWDPQVDLNTETDRHACLELSTFRETKF